MKAVSYRTTGPASVLEFGERPEPHAGPGEVRVRIHVSGVNPTDWKARSAGGRVTDLAAPQVPNQDGAGVVDELGSGVTEFAVGDRVWVWDAADQRPDGTAQELVVLPVRHVVPLPDDVGFDVGASLGIPALTAHRALTASERSPLKLAPDTLAGMVVLVAGGAGAVGHAAIQLAVWAGATVITTVSSPAKAELARAAGAHHVVDYRAEDAAAAIRAVAPKGVDIVVEVDPARNFALDVEVAAPDATVSVYASTAEPVVVPVRPSMTKNLRYQFLLTYTVAADVKDAAVRSVAAAVADGALPVGADAGLPITWFPLAETAAAHDAVEAGTVGKVLIDVAGSARE